MGETLKADPEWISGLGNYVLALNGSAWKAVNLVGAHAQSTGEFKGLMGKLKEPIDSLHTATKTRIEEIPPVLYGTSVNLKQAAWDYTTTDSEAGLGLRHTRTETYNSNPFVPPIEVQLGLVPDPVVTYEQVDDVPGTYGFGDPRAVDVTAPANESVNWNAIIESAAGWLADADSAIASLTHWSPIQSAVEPVAGNWMELKRIGKTYGKAGSAFDIISGDLGTGHRTVDTHWDGKAAVSYSSYSADLSRGLNWEGSVGRLLERGLTMAADQLEAAAKALIALVQKGLSRLVKVDSFEGILKLAAKAVPGAGTAAAVAEVTRLLAEVAIEAKRMIVEINKAIDALTTFVSFCKDPVGFATGKAEGKVKEELRPFTDTLDKIAFANDVATATEIDRVTQQPRTAYDPGTGPGIWEDQP
ncbi:hypothetical protein QSJ19_08545 [Gordonia sp. ABSL11-1]|uniref:hypothetical protein n=1 Tax=Gordonia sp. ABSL11-1 TaxID=3053924 RepID=UPI0025723781|nr:hypothetical protein [Gordonia sp. ABSL11-1]MDL9945634.1 hypothetical protein [Gordonia sp. ABSL11-1]